ncbi:branched-chain alpha-keto acid dehydrogenase subunit E2 [Actinoplanes sp. SE50]|uniref:dihydrolipoamide acetyltransferase family protein n=1 Tax=unclassified Actinoplanes TaxID=2626549 RepID=UPI00023ED15D|nr:MULTISPECIES: dihydrolipoamide acetyltransferase family protein [unclassified Actinoplanes]AEV81092.1 pyruvate dehydrogenase E2 component (dihydrolipoamide acetyltransferase) [Actinoplanes sp. SE50/110]ATO79493.1 branched-chain alpha-keto acid dehydrogenase subunit E2 [Actinoplanes sp. SE50]SLL96893.1 branched-chain alpha-keto acid dehydrogenase subunit E2 [Actinoplanes sp. SE50/110]
MSRIKEFNLPDLGEGLTEGEILAWLVKVGDTIELNQPIVEVETAKAAVEIPAKWAGVVTRIFHEAGTTVEVGQPIISIDTDPGAGDLPATPEPAAAPAAATPHGGGRTPVLVGYGVRESSAKRRPRISAPAASAPVIPAAPVAAPAPVAPVAPVAQAAAVAVPVRSGPVLAKPPVRKLAKDLGVDLATLTGSGPLGSITRDDVHKALEMPAQPVSVLNGDREQRIPVKGVRKLTAENMVASAFTAPHVTEFLTVDVTRSMKALEKLKARRDFADLRVSPLLLVAKAVLLAVKRYPMVNSSWSAAGPSTAEIVVKDYVNLGIAAATERGLIVPNIKDAGRLTLRELAESLNELVRTAKSGRTSPADMAHGTLSITNVGVFGVDTGTPILPPGESAILAFGAIRPTPWVHKGKIKVRQVTTLGLSFDHRIIDGELGSKFLRDIGEFLTDPEAALLAWT